MGRLRRLLQFDPADVDHLAEQLRAQQAAIVAAQETLGSFDTRLGSAETRLDQVEAAFGRLESRLDEGAGRLDDLTGRLDRLRDHTEEALAQAARSSSEQLTQVQTELSRAISETVSELETLRTTLGAELATVHQTSQQAHGRLDGVEDDQRVASSELRDMRDRTLPAVVDRTNVLIDRLCEEMAEIGSLVERLLLREPLPVPRQSPADEEAISRALDEVQPLLVERFRGSSDEIVHRCAECADLLLESAPVLDLGCGRGELLELLRSRGVEAVGVEADRALVAGARRRGLRVIDGDVTAVLSEQADASWGGVVAMHLFEHLQPAQLLRCLGEIRRVLRPGGVLMAECPNPHSLRVGGSLFWLDPTHVRPLLPETLELFMLASGLQPEPPVWRHPFPEEQRLQAALPETDDPQLAQVCDALGRLSKQLDELMNGARDFRLVARVPEADGLVATPEVGSD